MANGYANGSIKKKEWDSYIDSLNPKKKIIDVNKTIADMKRQGLPIEEG